MQPHSSFRRAIRPAAFILSVFLFSTQSSVSAQTAPQPVPQPAAPAPVPAPVAAAAPGAIHSGGLDFQLPSPAPDLVEAGVDGRTALEVLAPAQNRLIAGFVTAEDATHLHTTGAALTRYALVEVPRQAEFVDLGVSDFKEVTDAMDKQFSSILDSSVKDGEDEINQRLKALKLNDAKVSLDKPVQLGTFFSKPDAYGLGLVLPVTANGRTIKMITGVLILRVQSRLLYGYLYTVYQDEDSATWIRKASADWADAILAANRK